jgi:carbamoyltransferase
VPARSYVLGISAFYHDSAACLLCDGQIVAAAQEERFTRLKGDERFPASAIAFCLSRAGIAASDLAAVAFYDKPLLKMDRLLETYLYLAPRGLRSFLRAGPLWASSRLRVERTIREGLGDYAGSVLFCEHHESHAASAFYPSPFGEAAILTIDGVGEWATASIGHGDGAELQIIQELRWPDSLGLLYSAFTYHAGFKVNSGEYKLMGLAPYGVPRFTEAIYSNLMNLKEDGSFTLDQRYFNYLGGLTMTSAAFSELFGGQPRRPESPLTQREMDLAASIQQVTEEIVRRMARTAVRVTGSGNLCLAGGVALNAVANGKISRERIAKRLWIQPAAGDSGGALGAALLAHHVYLRAGRTPEPRDSMQGALLGPSFEPDEIAASLERLGVRATRLTRADVVQRAAEALSRGAVVGWFDGRMEFGPRALGARSILADARRPEMQATLNLKIKFREGFRPFAPSVLAARAAEFFALEDESPYMLVVAPVREERRLPPPADAGDRWGIAQLNVPRSDVPAITHLDYTARVQTVTPDRAPGLHEVLSAFERLTGCPLLVNTSFNVRGEPIVCTPEDAYACFMRTDMDYLAMPPFLLDKSEQPAAAAGQQRARGAMALD